MTVFELARRVGITPAAVRLYARLGVLPPPHPLPTGRRGYDDNDAALLRAMVGLRRLVRRLETPHPGAAEPPAAQRSSAGPAAPAVGAHGSEYEA